MVETFKDFYGCYAYLRTFRDGTARLAIYSGTDCIHHKRYKSRRGARIAMGKLSDAWSLVQKGLAYDDSSERV